MKIGTWLYWPTVIAIVSTERLLGRKTVVIGGSNMPKMGGCVLAPKHQGTCDPPTLVGVIKRMIYFMAKIELFHSNILARYYFNHSASFPVDRKNPRSFMNAIKTATQLVKSGKVVGIFPEGVSSPDKLVGELHRGPIKVAIDAWAPLVPIAIIYDNNRKSSPFRRGQRTCIVIGEPIQPSEFEALKNHTDQIALLKTRLVDLMLQAQERLGAI